ncbi:hypothetical protein FOFC_19202 [Fusarium oxysporum]|nr:hypothetical protein FOFC_19202 [Fusarium oxysporum]
MISFMSPASPLSCKPTRDPECGTTMPQGSSFDQRALQAGNHEPAVVFMLSIEK